MSEITPVTVPRENVNDETATLVCWYIENGQYVERGQLLAQVETSKATLEIEAPASGVVHCVVAAGAEVAIGGLICQIGGTAPASALDGAGAALQNGAEAVQAPRSDAVLPAPAFARPSDNHQETDATAYRAVPVTSTRLSRKAAQLAKELGLDPAQFAGRGLVRSQDVLPACGLSTPHAMPPETAAPPPSAPPDAGATGVPFRSERLPRAKRTEAKALRAAQNATLLSSVSVVCRTRGLRAAARQHATLGENATAIIIFEAARLLRSYPHFNAFHDDGTIHLYEEINIGFAVDAGRGLKVLVIHQADRKTIAEIADEMRELLVAYLSDELPLSALAGGTFTVTDLSGEGVFGFHPLVNRGQSAILGVGGEVFMPAAQEGIFNLVLAFDHQLAEGRAAARFLNELKQRLEHYERALQAGGGPSVQGTDEPCCTRCRMTPQELEPYGHYLVQTVRAGGVSRLLCTRCLRGY
jgi:pyruvate/2-oxoglutarate dehydrogenase complex dihydrolipoamide acyltransferase (E2) component